MGIPERHTRTVRMIGEEGLERLAQARVAVFGLGGVGSSCAEALVRGGVGRFLFVDKDAVEPSNLNRQAIAFLSTVGQRKVDVMRAMALDINPEADVETLDAFVKRETVSALLEPFARPDYIVDALDTMTAKMALALYAEEHGIPIIASMGGANKTDPTKLAFADLADTRVCPMCREMRKIARNNGIKRLQVLYSYEQPVKVPAQEGAERSEKTELGTMSYFPPIMGQMIAGYVISDIVGLLPAASSGQR